MNDKHYPTWKNTSYICENLFVSPLIAVNCPSCNFFWGTIDKRNIIPRHPISFKCRRDRCHPCQHEWSIAITEEGLNEVRLIYSKLAEAQQLINEVKLMVKEKKR